MEGKGKKEVKGDLYSFWLDMLGKEMRESEGKIIKFFFIFYFILR